MFMRRYRKPQRKTPVSYSSLLYSFGVMPTVRLNKRKKYGTSLNPLRKHTCCIGRSLRRNRFLATSMRRVFTASMSVVPV